MTEHLDWELETGLLDNIDAYIKNPRFGTKDEYLADQVLMIFDLESPEGELLGNQGYSVGSGWIVGENGLSMSHPTRHNVVNSCIYGQLQKQVVKVLGVNMAQYGKPTDATVWDGLGFHWDQLEHSTLTKGEVKTALMPTSFLGKREKTSTSAVPVTDIEKKLATMAGAMDLMTFQTAALRIAEVAENDALMGDILDDTDSGFWKQHQKS